jgi:pimeloyl-ACP methyl ester carboxylesterase
VAAARRHPALIDRMALLGVEGPDDTVKLPSRVDTVMATIARARRPTLLDDVRTLRSRLAAGPARLTFQTGQTIVVGVWDLQRWIAESLDTVQEIDAMLAAIPALLAGDHTALGQWALRARVPRPIGLMNLAMDCASYASPDRLARIAREAPRALLGGAINFPLPALCETPGLPRLPDAYRAPLSADVPALLVAGAFDGRTPVQNARDVARGLPRARVLVVEGASHGLFREAAVLDAVVGFLRAP